MSVTAGAHVLFGQVRRPIEFLDELSDSLGRFQHPVSSPPNLLCVHLRHDSLQIRIRRPIRFSHYYPPSSTSCAKYQKKATIVKSFLIGMLDAHSWRFGMLGWHSIQSFYLYPRPKSRRTDNFLPRLTGNCRASRSSHGEMRGITRPTDRIHHEQHPPSACAAAPGTPGSPSSPSRRAGHASSASA